MLIRRIVGHSMRPTLLPNDIVIAMRRRKPKIGDIAVVDRPDRELIKRISHIDKDAFFLLGDNAAFSTDSREFGLVPKTDILGIIIMQIRFATATKAPKPAWPQLLWIPYVAAVGWVSLLLLHLFFFEQFVAIMMFAFAAIIENLGAGWLDSGVAAKVYVALFSMSMLLALPFLLRMQLSPLMRTVSIVSIVVASLLYGATKLLFLDRGYIDFYAYGSLLFTFNIILVSFVSLVVLNAREALGGPKTKSQK